MSDRSNQIFFIACSPRSGSSLLRNKLDLLERVIALPSDLRLVEFLHKNRNASMPSMPQLLLKHWNLAKRGNVPSEIENLLTSSSPESISELVFSIFEQIASINGKVFTEESILVEKSPNNTYYLPTIRSLFKHAKVIHLVRDPRAVVAGLNQKSWSGHNTLSNAVRWSKEQRLLADRCDYLVEYESLVLEPEQTIEKLLKFMQFPQIDQINMLFHSQSINSDPRVRQSEKEINTRNIEKYKISLSRIEREQEIIEKVCVNEMNRYGYRISEGLYDFVYFKSLFFKSLEHHFNRFMRMLNGRKEYS